MTDRQSQVGKLDLSSFESVPSATTSARGKSAKSPDKKIRHGLCTAGNLFRRSLTLEHWIYCDLCANRSLLILKTESNALRVLHHSPATMDYHFMYSSFLGPKLHSPIGSMPFHRAQKLSISRAQPPPTCPCNGSARIKNITHGAV